MFAITKQVATDISKAMRREAAAIGLTVSHSSAMDRTARALGFRDFNGLAAAMKARPVLLATESVDTSRLLTVPSLDWSLGILIGRPANDAEAPRFRSAHEMVGVWLGSEAVGTRSLAITRLAPVLVGALLPSWTPDESRPPSPVAEGSPMVVATVRTDDGMREATFDAVPYLAQASDDALRALHDIGYRGDYAADDVAWHFHGEPGSEDVTDVLDHDQQARCGFEVVVDPDAALAWIAANRPDLHATLDPGDEVEAVEVQLPAPRDAHAEAVARVAELQVKRAGSGLTDAEAEELSGIEAQLDHEWEQSVFYRG